MNKNFLVTWLAAFVVWMFGSFLVHGVWLGETYAAMTNIVRPEEAQMGLFHFMLLAHVIVAGAFVWIYRRGQEAKPWLPQGLRFAVAVALLATVPVYMIYYTVQQQTGVLAIQQTVGDTLVLLAVGLVVAFLSSDKATT